MLEIPQLFEIIKEWGFGIKTYINRMMKMIRINYISVDVSSNIPIRGYGRKKIYKTSKYAILNNGAYYVHHDWDQNQNVR